MMMMKRKKDNGGFSLVELIIIIAIMAVLAGAIAPLVIRYIEKSRKSNIEDTAKKIYDSVNVAISDYFAGESDKSGDMSTFYDGDNKGVEAYHDYGTAGNPVCGRLTSETLYKAANGNMSWSDTNCLGKLACDIFGSSIKWANVNPGQGGMALSQAMGSGSYGKEPFVCSIIYNKEGVVRVELSKGKYMTVYKDGVFTTVTADDNAGQSYSHVN